ncbi:site-specific integrase [Actinoplanes sp. NPDC026623]|uniref:tyrosine-type recombinase/integrase n=1 Tax=Actinoplanes sp. NPDC026623 TaxID=3155610 RepID=UPI0033C84F26
MAGSIEPKNSGWRVVWRFNGQKQHTVPWPEEEIAKQALQIVQAFGGKITKQDVETAILGSDPRQDESTAPTLRVWCARWLPAKTRITPGTRRRYGRQLELRILPALGDLLIDQITPTDIGKFLNDLRADGLSNATLTRYYSVLHGALEAAIKEGLIQENPCDGTDFVRDQIADDDTGIEHRVYLTPEEFQLTLKEFDKDARLVVEVLAETGCRWSESTALGVQHLVAPSKSRGPRIRIWRAWKQDENNRWYLGSTKGRQRRTVGVSYGLYQKLVKTVAGRPQDAFILTAPQGGHVVYGNFYHRRWLPAITRAQRCKVHPPAPEGKPLDSATGLCSGFGGRRSNGKPCGAKVVPGFTRCRSHSGPARDAVSTCDCAEVLHVRPTPHDLRHTHASWLFADPNVAPLAISRRLGHANLQTTSEIYGGLMPEAEEAAVKAISSALGRRERAEKKASRRTEVGPHRPNPARAHASLARRRVRRSVACRQPVMRAA